MNFAWLVLASLAFLPGTAPDQPTITVLRTDFEQGIDYGVNWIEPVAGADVKCVTDKWKKMINWDYPAGQFENLVHPPENGKKLYSRKVFSKTGTHQVVAKIWVHCKDSAVEWTQVADSSPAKTIHVWARVPIKSADLSASTLKGGQPVSLHLVLSAPAPPSGTRITLTSPDPILSLSGLPVDDKGSFVTIPAKGTEATVQLQTKPVTVAMSVKVTAKTSRTVAAGLRLTP